MFIDVATFITTDLRAFKLITFNATRDSKVVKSFQDEFPLLRNSPYSSFHTYVLPW